MSCLSKLKVTPSFCFAFKISDNVTTSNTYLTDIYRWTELKIDIWFGIWFKNLLYHPNIEVIKKHIIGVILCKKKNPQRQRTLQNDEWLLFFDRKALAYSAQTKYVEKTIRKIRNYIPKHGTMGWYSFWKSLVIFIFWYISIFGINFRYCEKVTKFESISPFF